MPDSLNPHNEPLTVSPELARRVKDELGQNVYLCYQCIKCTNGCPLTTYFDWQPNQIMRALQLGQEEMVFSAQTPWLCASCQTCATRCPQDLDITAIMEFLTREALARGYDPAIPEVDIFNEAFLREVRTWGRAYELGLMAELKLRTHDLTSDLDLAMRMLRKRKIHLLPNPTRMSKKVKPIPGAAQAVAYYPGCSLETTAAEFDESTRAVCEALGLRLLEPKNWVCCGSSAAHRADPEMGLRLPLENLALIEQSGFSEVTMPCAACFNRHKTAQYEIRQHPEKQAAFAETLGYDFQDQVAVRSLMETILLKVGAEGIRNRVRQPLTGLRVVSYYGCLLTRPPKVTEAAHPENPVEMDEILQALGAEVIDWSDKTSCCGAAHSLTRRDIVLEMSGNLIKKARAAGADMIVVACPLCHANLDARQFQMDLDTPMPVLFFTQLLAVALGLPEKYAALDRNLVDPCEMLHARGFLAP